MKRLAQALLVVLVATACDQRTDPQIIEGHWIAENFRIQSIQLPIRPDLFISKSSLGLGLGLEPVQLSGIEADGSEVTLKTKFGFDVVFHVENKNKMYFTVPFIGDRIYYKRAEEPKTAAVSAPIPVKAEQAVKFSEPLTAAVVHAPSEHSLQGAQVTTPASAIQSRSLQHPPLAETDYQQAVVFLRQGNADASLRSLSNAFVNGFADWHRVELEPLFDQLQGDMRFQVLQARWKKK